PRFLLVQHGWGGSGFARTLHLEMPGLTTCIVNVPPMTLKAIPWIVAEMAAATGFVEAHYMPDGRRFESRLKLAALASQTGAKANRNGKQAKAASLGPKDVLLVTGGGKGIASECGLALALETGARLALLGRSDP